MSAESFDQDPPKQDTSIMNTIMDEIVIMKNKVSSDWEKNKEKSGVNHFMREGGKMYDQINSLGAYIIYGGGTENMSGGHKVKGNPKEIEASNMGNLGFGGFAAKKNSFLGLFQYLGSAFGFLPNQLSKKPAKGKFVPYSYEGFTVGRPSYTDLPFRAYSVQRDTSILESRIKVTNWGGLKARDSLKNTNTARMLNTQYNLE